MFLNIAKDTIEKSIKKFNGTWRRMQYRKKKGYNCKFIDDYAHHPTEIQATLKAVRNENIDSKILCIFQAHQHSRTKTLLREFGESFIDVDKVIIPNIYRVRDSEEEVKSVSTKDLVAEINKGKRKASNGNGLEKTAEFIKNNHNKYDIIITMGAGNITTIYKLL